MKEKEVFLYWSPWKPCSLYKPRVPHAVHVLLYPWDTQDFLNIFSPRRETLQWAAVPESLVGQRAWTFPARAGRTEALDSVTVHKYNYGLVHVSRLNQLAGVRVSLSRGLCGTLLAAELLNLALCSGLHSNIFLTILGYVEIGQPWMDLLLVLIFYRVGSHCFT